MRVPLIVSSDEKNENENMGFKLRKRIFLIAKVVFIVYISHYVFQLLRLLSGMAWSVTKYPVLSHYAHNLEQQLDHHNNDKTHAGLNNEHFIPAIMHHLSPSEEIPEIWQYPYESCVFDALHKRKFTFKLWTDESAREFIATYYTWFIEVYDSYPHNIQRVDAARYFILHHFGGIYLDCDVGCRTQLDFFRFQSIDALFPITSPIGVSNDVMFAIPEHPFFDFLIHQLANYNVNWLFKYPTVMFTTGPGFLSYMLYLYSFTSQGSSNDDHDHIALLDNFAYTEVNFFHVEGSSWHGWDARLCTVRYAQVVYIYFL